MGDRITPDSAIEGDRVRIWFDGYDCEALVVGARPPGKNFVDVRIDDGTKLFGVFNYEVIQTAAPTADTGLHLRIAEALQHAFELAEGSQHDAPPFWDDVAEGVYQRVIAPVLADHDAENRRLRNVVDDAAFAERALHLVLGCCTAESIADGVDCPGRVREVYDAVRAGQPTPFHWPTIVGELRRRNRRYGQASATIGALRGEIAQLRGKADESHLDVQEIGATVTEIQRQLADMIDADGSTPIWDLLSQVRDALDILSEAVEPRGDCRPECDCGDHQGPGQCGCHVTGEEAREWIRRADAENETLRADLQSHRAVHVAVEQRALEAAVPECGEYGPNTALYCKRCGTPEIPIGMMVCPACEPEQQAEAEASVRRHAARTSGSSGGEA